MYRKAPKKLRDIGIKKLRLIEPGDVLVCGQVSRGLPEDRLVAACFGFFKLGWLENARLLGVDAGDKYVLMLNLLSTDSADRVRNNLARHPVADLELCEPPLEVASRVRPWGKVMPRRVSDPIMKLLSEDPDIREDVLQRSAERMDRDPDGDYIFPNLPAELYAAVKAAQKKKPV
jgi:hypothetical protein